MVAQSYENSPMEAASTREALRDLPPRPVRWTRAQYHAMGEMGWFQNRRVELLAGEIIEMSPIGDRHWLCTNLATEVLRGAFSTGFVVSTQSALRLSENSEPEPDIAVMRGDLRSMTTIPSFAEMVVEVSDTTLSRDLTQKADLYAAARIPELWVIDLVHDRLVVHRRPRLMEERASGFGYALVEVHDANAAVAPLAAENAAIAVADLLPQRV